MYCGIVLTGSTDDPCGVAFLDDDTTVTASASTNDDIIALLQEHRPDVVALNAPPEREERSDFRPGEQDLVDGGHRLLPHGMRDRQVLERAAHLARQIEAAGIGCRIIESDPHVVARMLDIADDDALADQGIVPDDIGSDREFDAAVLALVAKMEADEETEHHDLVVPEGATEQEDVTDRDEAEPEVTRDERFL